MGVLRHLRATSVANVRVCTRTLGNTPMPDVGVGVGGGGGRRRRSSRSFRWRASFFRYAADSGGIARRLSRARAHALPPHDAYNLFSLISRARARAAEQSAEERLVSRDIPLSRGGFSRVFLFL